MKHKSIGVALAATLIAAAPGATSAILSALTQSGINAVRFGEVVDASEGRVITQRDGTTSELPVFSRDEITRLFE